VTNPSVGDWTEAWTGAGGAAVAGVGGELVHDRGDYWIAGAPWTSAGARDLLLDAYLAPSEREDLARLAPAARNGRALGRIVAKEAVRRWLADAGVGPVALGSIRIGNDPGGRPRVTIGMYEPVAVSIAHCGSTAVAAVAAVRAGVDVEAIEARGPVFARLALTPSELRLGEGHDPDEWVTRLWTVKEAVAKVEGTGLRGRPKDIVVSAVEGDLAVVGGHVVRSAREGDMVVSAVMPGA
jgi:phosphopantetheinyl transferase